MIQIADPNSEEQYKDGLTFFRNYALTQVSEDYSSIKEVDFILDNMNAPDGYSAVNSLSEKTIADGSDVYLFIGEFHVPVVE